LSFASTSQSRLISGSRYDRATITLHWLTAILVSLLWTSGQTVDLPPAGLLRIDYRSLHITTGVLLAVVFITRVVWRTAHGEALPPEGNVWLARLASIVHWVLYLLLPTALVLGLANVWARGDVIYNLFQIPALDPGDGALRRLIGDWHALAANAIMIVAALHAVAALFHHYVLRDGVLRRMLPMA
jgi:cytochrome b561